MQAAVRRDRADAVEERLGAHDVADHTEATNYFNALFNRTDVTISRSRDLHHIERQPDRRQRLRYHRHHVHEGHGLCDAQHRRSSTVSGATPHAVGLVLDNTGSMHNRQDDRVKTAAKNLPTNFRMPHANGDVYVSIVPFSRTSTSIRSLPASWVRWDLWDAQWRRRGFSGSFAITGRSGGERLGLDQRRDLQRNSGGIC